jgi:hypothetical protein
LAIIGAAGEYLGTIAEFALSEHLQTIADADMRALQLKALDRSISSEQRDKMLAVLGTRTPASIVVNSFLDDGGEARRYAESIYAIFRDALWNVNEPTGTLHFSRPVTGILISISDKPSPEAVALAKFVGSVLHAGELSWQLNADNMLAPNMVEVLVAGKSP